MTELFESQARIRQVGADLEQSANKAPVVLRQRHLGPSTTDRPTTDRRHTMQDIVRVLRDGTAEFPTNCVMMQAADEIESLRSFINQSAASKKSTVHMYHLLVDFVVKARQDYKRIWYSHYDKQECQQFFDLIDLAKEAIKRLDEDSSFKEDKHKDQLDEDPSVQEDEHTDHLDEDPSLEEDVSSDEVAQNAVPKVVLGLAEFATRPVMMEAKTEIDRLRALAELLRPTTSNRIHVYAVLERVMTTLCTILPFLCFESIDDEFVDKCYDALKQARRLSQLCC